LATLKINNGNCFLTSAIAELHNLIVLDLIPDDWRPHWYTLSEELSSLFESLGNLKNLAQLNLSLPYGVSFDIFCNSLKQLKNLTTMNLRLNRVGMEDIRIGIFTEALESLQKLSELSLELRISSLATNNGRKTLSTTIGKLQQLTKLHFNLIYDDDIWTELCGLDETIGKLHKLTELSLPFYSHFSADCISRLILSIATLKNLDKLKLEMGGLYRVRNLSDEDMDRLSQSLEKLQNLSEISLNLVWVKATKNAVMRLKSSVAKLNNLIKCELHVPRIHEELISKRARDILFKILGFVCVIGCPVAIVLLIFG